MPKKKTRSRLGRNPLKSDPNTSQDPKVEKEENKGSTSQRDSKANVAVTNGSRDVQIEFDSKGNIVSSFELIHVGDPAHTVVTLQPHANNKVEKFSFSENLLKLHDDFKVDVTKKKYRLIKK